MMFVKVKFGDEIVEIPTEDDGSMAVESLSSQFANAIGLK